MQFNLNHVLKHKSSFWGTNMLSHTGHLIRPSHALLQFLVVEEASNFYLIY